MSVTTYKADVIQYLLPDGRTVPVAVELPVSTRTKYEAMEDAGCRFEAEVLTTGAVSVTIFHVQQEIDVDIQIVKNGPTVSSALIEMLQREMYRPERLAELVSGG